MWRRLVERGGHNLLEAAAWGKPLLFGPFIDDFYENAELLRHMGVGFKVYDAEELYQRVMSFHLHPEAYRQAAKRAAQTAKDARGAAKKQALIIKQQLELIT